MLREINLVKLIMGCVPLGIIIAEYGCSFLITMCFGALWGLLCVKN